MPHGRRGVPVPRARGAGIIGAGHPGPHHRQHHPEGVAGVLEVRPRATSSRPTGTRTPTSSASSASSGARSSSRSSACSWLSRSASASPCSPPRSPPGACARAITTVMDLLGRRPVGRLRPRRASTCSSRRCRRWFDTLGQWCAGIPILQRCSDRARAASSLLTAGMVLAIMITPIITSVSREVFATVPRNDKEGALALGATRVGDDHRRGAPALARRPHRCGDARARTGHGRDHRGGAAHRWRGQPADHGQHVRPRRRHALGASPATCRGERRLTAPRSSASASRCSPSPWSSTSRPAELVGMFDRRMKGAA